MRFDYSGFYEKMDVDNLLKVMEQDQLESDRYESVNSVLLYDTKVLAHGNLSIVVPTFKRFDTLIELLESIKIQTTEICQIVIVDNSGIEDVDRSSVEELVAIFSSLPIKYYVNEKNIGMIGNWNRCVKLADTEYVAMIHDDDILSRNYLDIISKCINIAEKKAPNFGIIRTNSVVFNHVEDIKDCNIDTCGGVFRITTSDILWGYPASNPPTCGMVFKKSAFLKCGTFIEETYPSADYYMSIQMYKNGYEILETIDVLGFYRIAINESMNPKTQMLFARMGSFLMAYAFEKFAKEYDRALYKAWYFDWVRGCYLSAKKADNNVFLEDFDLLGQVKLNGLNMFFRKIYRVLKMLKFCNTKNKVIKI